MLILWKPKHRNNNVCQLCLLMLLEIFSQVSFLILHVRNWVIHHLFNQTIVHAGNRKQKLGSPCIIRINDKNKKSGVLRGPLMTCTLEVEEKVIQGHLSPRWKSSQQSYLQRDSEYPAFLRFRKKIKNTNYSHRWAQVGGGTHPLEAFYLPP